LSFASVEAGRTLVIGPGGGEGKKKGGPQKKKNNSRRSGRKTM